VTACILTQHTFHVESRVAEARGCICNRLVDQKYTLTAGTPSKSDADQPSFVGLWACTPLSDAAAQRIKHLQYNWFTATELQNASGK